MHFIFVVSDETWQQLDILKIDLPDEKMHKPWLFRVLLLLLLSDVSSQGFPPWFQDRQTIQPVIYFVYNVQNKIN